MSSGWFRACAAAPCGDRCSVTNGFVLEWVAWQIVTVYWLSPGLSSSAASLSPFCPLPPWLPLDCCGPLAWFCLGLETVFFATLTRLTTPTEAL